MLLAIDMGNTQTALGLFDADELVRSWRMPTDRTFTADEIHVRLLGYLRMYGLTLECVDEIAFAGVVPQLTREWRAFAQRIAARSIAVGADTNICVLHTLADAYFNNYSSIVVTDATMTFLCGTQEGALEHCEKCYGSTLCTATELEAALA